MYEFAERFMNDSEFFIGTVIVSLLALTVGSALIAYLISEGRSNR